MLLYHCTLWCVAALTRQHIITSSFKFVASLADVTCYSHTSLLVFQFLVILLLNIFMSISMNSLFCIIKMNCFLGLASTEKDFAMGKL